MCVVNMQQEREKDSRGLDSKMKQYRPVESCNIAETRTQAKQVDADSPALNVVPFDCAELKSQPRQYQKPCSSSK